MMSTLQGMLSHYGNLTLNSILQAFQLNIHSNTVMKHKTTCVIKDKEISNHCFAYRNCTNSTELQHIKHNNLSGYLYLTQKSMNLPINLCISLYKC